MLRIQTLLNYEVTKIANDIASMIVEDAEEENYKNYLVLAIANGGYELINRTNNLAVKVRTYPVYIRHKSSKHISKKSSILKKLPYFITDNLRRFSLLYNRISNNSNRVATIDHHLIDNIKKANKIYIIDDCYELGHSINMLVEFIESCNSGIGIKVFVGNKIYNQPPKHDIDITSIYDNCMVRWPWNADYKNIKEIEIV